MKKILSKIVLYGGFVLGLLANILHFHPEEAKQLPLAQSSPIETTSAQQADAPITEGEWGTYYIEYVLYEKQDSLEVEASSAAIPATGLVVDTSYLLRQNLLVKSPGLPNNAWIALKYPLPPDFVGWRVSKMSLPRKLH